MPQSNLPMNVLAKKALISMGAKPEVGTMPITHLMILALQDNQLGDVRDKPDIWRMVDNLGEMPEDEALERLDLLEIPQGWKRKSWQGLAGSLLNRVGDLRDEMLNG